MILADGARAETFEALLRAGELPEISRHVVERGSLRRGTSVFTSTTGPAHIPLLTGCFPGTANVPGYRWFDRERYRGYGPAAPYALRSYNGPEASWFDRDMSPAHPTLYELVPGSVGAFGVVTRGLDPSRNLMRRRKSLIWAHSHFFCDYDRADGYAARLLGRAAEADSRFRFVAFPGIDWNCHYIGEDCPEAIAAYGRIDQAVGEAARRLKATGKYEETMITIVSDHGHRAVHTHFDIALELARRGLRVAYHPWPAFRPRFDAVACVSGNGMAQIYLPGADGSWGEPALGATIEERHPGLVRSLVAEAAIDIVVTRAEGGGLLIESSRGAATLAEAGSSGDLDYSVHGGADPFGFDQLPRRMTSREALEATAASQYPDALVQLAQLFRSPRAGDVVISATPGFDLRERFERPQHFSSHGALIRDHMLVPVASSVPLADGTIRTADVAASAMEYLGLEAPAGIDGESRLL